MPETTLAALTPDTRNANAGTERGGYLVETSLRQHGAGRSILVDKHGRIIAGNKTYTAAGAIGLEDVILVPSDGTRLVAVQRTDIDLDTPEGRALAIADNRSSEVGLDWDVGVLAELQADGVDLAPYWFPDELAELLIAAPTLERLDTGAGLDLTRADVPDALLPTDNAWGVPVLNLAYQATALALPAVKWGTIARTRKHPGIYHFYTGDYKFDGLWADPSGVPNSGCPAVVEPNFSTNPQMPRAVVLWGIYRKRWLARWWQDQGVRIFVDLCVEPDFADLALLGVPAGWRAYATRGYADRLADTEAEWTRAAERAGSDDLLFVVYGGGKAHQALCQARGWVWIPEEADSARGRYTDGTI